jgi:hypothetical protein
VTHSRSFYHLCACVHAPWQGGGEVCGGGLRQYMARGVPELCVLLECAATGACLRAGGEGVWRHICDGGWPIGCIMPPGLPRPYA